MARKSIKSATLPEWRSLEIPVDVPQRRVCLSSLRKSTHPKLTICTQLLTAISLTPTLSPSTSIYQGRPLAFLLKLSTSSQWMGLPSELTKEEKTQRLVYDVQVNPEDWIVLGKKKAYFIPDVSLKTCYAKTRLIISLCSPKRMFQSRLYSFPLELVLSSFPTSPSIPWILQEGPRKGKLRYKESYVNHT